MFHIQGTVHKMRTEKLLNLVFWHFFPSLPIAFIFEMGGFIQKRRNLSFLFPLTHTHTPHPPLPPHPPPTPCSQSTWEAESVFALGFCFNIQNSGLESSTFPVLKPDTLTLYALWCLSHLLEMEYRKRQLRLGGEGKLVTSVDHSTKTAPTVYCSR